MRKCWLCGRTGVGEPLDKHHIFGGPYRKKSEKYGLTVDLCHYSCHIFGEKAAHNCKETMDELHRYGQKLAMLKLGMTTEDFIREFGRNYLDTDEPMESPKQTVNEFFVFEDESFDTEIKKIVNF